MHKKTAPECCLLMGLLCPSELHVRRVGAAACMVAVHLDFISAFVFCFIKSDVRTFNNAFFRDRIVWICGYADRYG